MEPLLLDQNQPARAKKLRCTPCLHPWNWLQDASREISHDLRTVGWKRACFYILALFCAFSHFYLLICLNSAYGIYAEINFESGCLPDGSFTPMQYPYNPWSANGVFQTTWAFGPLSFTAAKIIDVAWDFLAGHGSQLIVTTVSWNVFADFVAISMAASPVTYATFFTIYIQRDPSISSIIRLVRDFTSQRGLVSRSAMVFMVLTMLFALALPTLVSAMTSYNAVTQAMVLKVDGTYEPLLQFQPLAYMVHDGWRIDLTGDYPVSYVNYSNTSSGHDPLIYGDSYWVKSYCRDPSQSAVDLQFSSSPYPNDLDCQLQVDISQYVREYGFYGLTDTTTIWKNQTLPPPSLNISGFYLQNLAEVYGETDFLFGNTWVMPGGGRQPFQDKSQMSWTSSNITYNIEYMAANDTCQPLLNKYQWGFSFVQLYILIILFLLWAIGLFLMQVRASLQLTLPPESEIKRMPRGWKWMLELSGTISAALQDSHLDVDLMSERELQMAIQKRLRGGRVYFFGPLAAANGGVWQAFRQWLLRERWWFGMLVLLVVGIPVSIGWSNWHPLVEYLPYNYYSKLPFFFSIMCLCLSQGICFALAVGRRLKVRMVITFLWLGIALIIGVPMGVYT